MRKTENGHTVVTHKTGDPAKLKQPYQALRGDLFTCRTCGRMVIADFGNPTVEPERVQTDVIKTQSTHLHYEDNFDAKGWYADAGENVSVVEWLDASEGRVRIRGIIYELNELFSNFADKSTQVDDFALFKVGSCSVNVDITRARAIDQIADAQNAYTEEGEDYMKQEFDTADAEDSDDEEDAEEDISDEDEDDAKDDAKDDEK